MNELIAWCPGHGENTYRETGGKGVPGMAEHEFNAAVVGYAMPLAEYNGFRSLLVQPLMGKDRPLNDRINHANAAKADFYFSVHADANASKDAWGHWGAYWYLQEPKEDKKALANKSYKFAQIWQKHADAILPNTNLARRIFPSVPGTWSNYAVCRDTKMPAFLGEHAFMTNAKDLALLKSESFRKQCAEVAVRALCEYFGRAFKKPQEPSEAPKVQTPSEAPKNPPTGNSDVVVRDWKDEGLEWLQKELGLSSVWKKTDPIDMGTLGTLLKRLHDKLKGVK